jgi:hypothetical protein
MYMRAPRSRAARIALYAAGAIVAALGLAQLLLPGLAAQRVRNQLERYGTVRSATVSAFPAIELLWGSAESATVSAANLNVDPSQLGELLWQGRGVQRATMHAESVSVGSFTMLHVSTQKHGDELYTQGLVTEAELLAAIPGGRAVQLLGSTPEGVEMRVTESLLGVEASVEVLLSAQEGNLVVQPQGIPFAGFAKFTLISSPHVYVQDFDLTAASSAAGAGGGTSFLLRIWAKLR